ncbi:hypothetical protein ACQPW1_10355 [Nocardia sp. CA-128927]|uniref:hypothetical protein n=1 Tax=Nocardia sp. CA-128927 TaxID=3239975 RepID=UPI003D96EFBC
MDRKLRRINNDLMLVIENGRMVGAVEPIASSVWFFTDINDCYFVGDDLEEGVVELCRVESGQV